MRNKFLKVSLMALAATFASCNLNDKPDIIGKQHPQVVNGRMSPEVLWGFGRLGGVQVSPTEKQILYTVSYYSVEENKSNTEIFVMNTDGTSKVQLSVSPSIDTSPKWYKDGRKILFLSNRAGAMQLWTMDSDGSDAKQISWFEGGINDFSLSPDENKILFVANLKYGERVVDKYPDLPKSSGIIVEDLMYKHWDEWVETIPHPFVADFTGKKIKNPIDILYNEPFQSPMKPFGGMEQLAWSPDSKNVAYTCKKKTGLAYAVSTNSDIYIYNLETKKTVNATEGMMGYDMNPLFSPDGKWMIWQSMERDGYEADKNRLFMANLQTGAKVDLSASFDQNVESPAWSLDSKLIYFTSVWHGTTQIYKADLAEKKIVKITSGKHDYESVIPTTQNLIAVRHSMSKPNEIYAVNPIDGTDKELSYENLHLLEQVEMGKVEERWVTTTDDKQMLVWVIYPPQFDPNKKYPTLLYCQGGPQSAVSQFWSYRWNLQTFAASDYIIVAPNRRGLPGFGQEWNEQISGDYGGQNMKDYLSAIDNLAQEPFVDNDRLGAVGASYGGFSVFWLAGHHEKRFKAFIAHDGMFNFEQQYLETEEMWFANWDLGGPYWDKNNEIAQRSYANSPHLFVDKWDTPLLVIHGEKDYRILASQGMAAFNAAKLRGVPARLLVYPDENHWVLKPQNGVLWQRNFVDWLDKWLK